jgi:hypothetical protein
LDLRDPIQFVARNVLPITGDGPGPRERAGVLDLLLQEVQQFCVVAVDGKTEEEKRKKEGKMARTHHLYRGKKEKKERESSGLSAAATVVDSRAYVGIAGNEVLVVRVLN